MVLSQLLSGIKVLKATGSLDEEILSVSYDSRNCDKHSLFVAIKGTKTDGHKFIKSLVKQGVKSIVCEKNPLKQPNWKRLYNNRGE